VILVPVLHCPKCGSRLDFHKGGDIWTVTCSSCNTEVSVGGRKVDLFDAYEAYTAQIQAGTASAMTDYRRKKYLGTGADTPRKKRRKLDPTSRVQTPEAIEKLVGDGGADFSELSESLRKLLTSGRDYLVKYQLMPASDADYGVDIDKLSIPTRLKEHLRDLGITTLYKFQEDSYKAIENGEDLVIAAPTGQGKTEGFILPIIRKLLLTVQESFANPGVRALLIYPTKALARDQYDKIKRMCDTSNLTVSIFDGDVSQNARQKIYEAPPDILLTNPDVLHCSP
jgi:superfamily II DNA helicase RecQ